MSADLTRKTNRQISNGQTVLPQPVSNPSIIESVAGFIHEVVPQAYSSVLPGETRESISWARFEVTDYNDPENYYQVSECESESTPPLLLILGYSTGVQVWGINGSGDASELLSWSQGAVKTLKLLDRPRDGADLFSNKRPLVAVVDSSGPGPQFCTVNFVSLRTAEVIKSIKFKTPICDIHCNKKSIVITFSEKIAVFDIGTLEDRLTVTTCFPSPGACINPVALGSRWLAYAEKRVTTWQRSSGGCESDGSQSYTSTVIHAAKSLSKGLRDLSGSLTGSSPSTTNNNAAHPGIVTIIDIEVKPTKEDDPENLICHFVGHVGPIVAMTFDPSGMLLVTADKHGHRFHVYRIQPHPCCPQLAAVHHLYILHRGETTARVQDIAISLDSRWVAVSSVRGTTHVFPITPYGGPVTVRTHTTPHVVNRLSRFERSAGLSDGRGSPLPEAPCQPSTPRLPPYPVPCVLLPLAQIRRTDESPLAATFAVPRAWIPGQVTRQNKRSLLDSLFVISSGGCLIQYDLEPRPIPGIAKDKISYDTGIELGVDAKAEWPLLKPPYSSNLQPPLPSNNPLLQSITTEVTPDPRTMDDRWMSQVEIVTHTGPHRRLWMGPQFSFKAIDPLAPTGFEMNTQNDNTKPTRSNPVNMPHRPFLLVESGSAGSVESPHMTDYGSSSEDIQHGESRLREDLADAMLETVGNSSGVLVGASTSSSSSASACTAGVATSSTGASSGVGRLKAAILERQVNPLGTVITLPAGGADQQQHLQASLASTAERRHHPQLYHEVLPAAHQIHIKTSTSEESFQDSSKKIATPITQPSSASELVSVSKKDAGSITHKMKTTCAEVQTIPFDVPSSTISKSIQTSVATEKKSTSKSEQKAKGKTKKKTSKNLDDNTSCSKKTLSNSPSEKSEEKDEVEICGIKKCSEVSEQNVEKNIIAFEISTDEIKTSVTSTENEKVIDIKAAESSDTFIAEELTSDSVTTIAEKSNEEPVKDSTVEEQLTEKLADDEVMFTFSSLIDSGVTGVKLEETGADKGQDESKTSLDLLTGDFGQSAEEEAFKDDTFAINDNLLFDNDDLKKDTSALCLTSVCDDQQYNVETDKANLLDDPFNESIPDNQTTSLMKFITETASDRFAFDDIEESGESSSQREESSVTGNDSSDDRKCKKEVIRKSRSSETENITVSSSVKDFSEYKKQPSPSKVESVKDDTESSDEPNSKASDSRTNSLKLVKRKKGSKKSQEHTQVQQDDQSSSTSASDVKTKSKTYTKKNDEEEEGFHDIERSDYETCSEKKSDSSVESFPEYKKKSMIHEKRISPPPVSTPVNTSNFSETRSWSAIVKNTDKEPVRPANNAEDRDSVYESCNDEDFPALNEPVNADQTAFESSKEEFEEQPSSSSSAQAPASNTSTAAVTTSPSSSTSVVKLTTNESGKLESGSSNTEEKTDSGEKDLFTSIKNLKKVKKQKKRKR
ncbi:hypothetical protein O3M35_006868 [Rhynocoris fuscipes]|uniref:BCAS3 WD40 domain-containing protein n=1 Tax=Rhynocoris fuscipes TaxID=488301 RepID=A0AAW1DHB9_9HEMI